MSETVFRLAQINIARMRVPPESPEVAEFIDGLDRINAVADASPGFVWRLVGDGNNAMDVRHFDDPLIFVNMSVWTDLPSLGAFVYRSEHVDFMRRRREWFEPMESAFMALWWIPAGHIPTVAEAAERLESLRKHGSTPFAFTFKQPFPPTPEATPEPPVLDECA